MADDRLTGSEILRLGLAYVLVASTTRATSEKELPRNPPPAPGTRGSSAASGSTSPKQIPARGWWDIAKSVWAKIGKDRVIAVAAGLTFYAILALFPAITQGCAVLMFPPCATVALRPELDKAQPSFSPKLDSSGSKRSVRLSR
jgi:hypothetical protein